MFKENYERKINFTLRKLSFLHLSTITGIVSFSIIMLMLMVNPSHTFSSSSPLFVSVFAQTPSLHLDYKTLEVSNTGVVQGNIIKEKSDVKNDIRITQIHVKIKAIGVGQTLVHCFNTEQKKNIVKSSGPFLATGQTALTVSKDNTAFTLQLQPASGVVNCDKPSQVVRGPATVFSNIEVALSQ